mgnify:CR=1 FL=1
MGNVYDPTRQIAHSRGNLSFTSINLPRIAIESKGDEKLFYEKLQAMLELVAQQLLDRFEIQASKHIYNYPFLMGQGIWLDSDHLGLQDDLREVLKHGTLSIGFIGLAECLKALRGAHHGESEESQNLGLEIIGAMRAFTDRISRERGLNYALIATPGVLDIVVYEGQSRRGMENNAIVAEIYPDKDYFDKNAIPDKRAYFKEHIDTYNKTAVPYKKIGVLKVREDEFPKNTLRKIMRFKIDMSID